MRGVYRKELRQYFHTMTGYAFISMFLCIAGAVFVTGNLLSQRGEISVFFSSLSSLMIYLLPILTMRMYAEEKRQRTDELLLTAPVSIASIMIGKFLSALTVFLIPLAVTLIYPAILFFYGFFEPMTILGCYVGCILLAGALIAIGQFLSVLTDSQFVAAIVTYSLFTLMAMAGNVSTAIDSPLLKSALNFAAIASHMAGFSYGVFYLKEAVYYVSITALLLFGSVYVLQRKRVA